MSVERVTPYTGLDGSRYWRTGVADVAPDAMDKLYKKKFDIAFTDSVATAGSCFAQHVARHMRRNGYQILDMEILPHWMPEEVRQKYGYMLYSARYGNIYTTRQLLQLVKDSQTGSVSDDDIWERDGRYFDALRPSVEPDGLESVEQVRQHRRYHLGKVKEMFAATDVFVFTLGLTETWENIATGRVYPTVPGLLAGDFDANRYRFLNLGFQDVLEDFIAVRTLLKAINPNMRFILTVSPVPLTATASANHILVATIRSKSILRAVCDTLYTMFDDVDYFPSYEIITAPNAHGDFYESNLRSVTALGVETVMKNFFAEHPAGEAVRKVRTGKAAGKMAGQRKKPELTDREKAENVVCEDALLEAFSK